MEFEGGREIEVLNALEEVAPARIASTIWLKTFCYPLVSDKIEAFTFLVEGVKIELLLLWLCSNNRKVFAPIWYDIG